MKFACLADLHGCLPDIRGVDAILIAGDICPDGTPEKQAQWLDKEFREWLEYHPQVFACWGNHDWVGQSKWVPRDLPWKILTCEVTEFEGKKIGGFPWTTVSPRWAFHKERLMCEIRAEEFYAENPCDILLNHTPPLSVGDKVLSGDKVGSHALISHLSKAGAPLLCVTGHIHEGRGTYLLPDGGLVCHASYLDEYYRPYKLDIPIIDVL